MWQTYSTYLCSEPHGAELQRRDFDADPLDYEGSRMSSAIYLYPKSDAIYLAFGQHEMLLQEVSVRRLLRIGEGRNTPIANPPPLFDRPYRY